MSHREIIQEALESYKMTIGNCVRLGNTHYEDKLAAINVALHAVSDDESFVFLGTPNKQSGQNPQEADEGDQLPKSLADSV